MSKGTLDCRAAAALCLSAVTNGASLSQQLPLFEARVKERDRSLYRQLCYGTLRFYPKLMACLTSLLNKPLKKKDNDVLMLMLLGIYQLSELRIPDHAAVSATVAAHRALKKPWSKGLINAVLRNWQRQGTNVQQSLTAAEQVAHPEWLHQALHKAWPRQASAIEAANNAHPPMCLRVNRQQQQRDAYIEQLQTVNIAATPCEFAIDGLRLTEPVDVGELPGFEQGMISVQDEAPQLSSELLKLQPGQRVLDACCAPGGKTSHCLEAEPALKEMVALDIDEQRLQRVQQNLDRLQVHASLRCADAANIESWWDDQVFDRILLDAPCSATGVIRRNPDIKLHRQPDDIDQLSQLQLTLLKALWPTLAPDGLLLYATCSVLPQENEAVVSVFLQQQADAEQVLIEANWGISCSVGRQLFPQVNGHDGFYYALLRKQQN